MVRTCVRLAFGWLLELGAGTSALLWKPLKPPLPQTKARNHDGLKLSAPVLSGSTAGLLPALLALWLQAGFSRRQ